ncbi:hypothetical protein N9332_00560 [Candidatus Pelagibacter sp.]|nr:hypothetical protein [Candidatus Pelagibacter sp.]
MSNFFEKSDISRKEAENIISDTLKKCDDGELYLENSKSESILLDDNKIKNSSYNSDLGFGFRAVSGEVVAYSHSNEISKNSLKQSSDNLKSTLKSTQGTYNHSIPKSNEKYYDNINPIDQKNLNEKIEILNEVNQYLRSKDNNVKQVTANFSGEQKSIEIIRSGGETLTDVRPLIRFNVSVMLEILLTQMRREGFEMTVSPPKVLYRKDESGNKLEPIEEITMDLDEEHSSKIIDSMNRRKGKLIELKDTGKDKKRLIFHAPTRGLMGYTSRFLTLTKGNGVINRIFHDYGPFEGEMEGRRNGALISMEQGKAVAFAIFNLQARGEMFVTHNDPVYPGMIVGLAPKPGDMIINVMKGKKLTNMRTQGTDENVVLTPVRKMSIAEQLSMLNTDEALEITPESCRLRKAILDPHERKRSEKSGSAA